MLLGQGPQVHHVVGRPAGGRGGGPHSAPGRWPCIRRQGPSLVRRRWTSLLLLVLLIWVRLLLLLPLLLRGV